MARLYHPYSVLTCSSTPLEPTTLSFAPNHASLLNLLEIVEERSCAHTTLQGQGPCIHCPNSISSEGDYLDLKCCGDYFVRCQVSDDIRMRNMLHVVQRQDILRSAQYQPTQAKTVQVRPVRAGVLVGGGSGHPLPALRSPPEVSAVRLGVHRSRPAQSAPGDPPEVRYLRLVLFESHSSGRGESMVLDTSRPRGLRPSHTWTRGRSMLRSPIPPQ